MGHYIVLSDEDDMEVPGSFIHIVLDRLKEVAGSDEEMSPLVGDGKYEWNSSLKVIPLADLTQSGLTNFRAYLRAMIDELPTISRTWNDPGFERIFRTHAESLIRRIEDQSASHT